MSKTTVIPVIMCQDNCYIRDLNAGMLVGLQMIYETQVFPVKGDIICFQGYDPLLITQRVFVSNPEPMIYLFTPFWSKEDEKRHLYEQCMGENNEEGSEDEKIYQKMVDKSIWDYWDMEEIFKIQKGLLT